MRKLILKCGLSPGDIVMLTATVRDLHRCYPGSFLTDVRTLCPELWENNPYVTPLRDDDPQAEQLDCSYPLINRCDEAPYHCLHGFIEFLNDRLHLSIRPSVFKGDVHLSEQEKAWYSQVHELSGEDTPFWIVAAGGKYDVTIKWWESERYQQVVDHFRGKVQFVQVGGHGHHHPRLEGVIDLRGQTSLRELVRLVYHSQGVLCSITALMHLAAAVPNKPGRPGNRPCVVVAGGREPAHWEAYPDHQFIHTNGALACCRKGGCWKDRTARLRDGDKRDHAEHRCREQVNGLPRCMDLITPAEVIRRIELYYQGGTLRYLSPRQWTAAERGIIATASNRYDEQPLNLHSAGMACDRFLRNIPSYPGQYEGRGIVICGGGVRYLTCAWVCINMLRRLGCCLPIQLWHLGGKEMDDPMRDLLARFGVNCVDALRVRRHSPARILQGWELKPYAIIHSPFREVLLLDADNVPVINPEFLFETRQFQETGAIFWPDYQRCENAKAAVIWKSCGLRPPAEPEFETGQIVVDKQRCWPSLRLCMWFNEHSDFYYQYLHGDKETFHLAFRKVKQDYSLVPKPIHSLAATMCQHDFEGRRIFQHRNRDKWDLFLHNREVQGFWFEEECRGYITKLQGQWDGGMSLAGKAFSRTVARRGLARRRWNIEAVMISCVEREDLRRRTLDNLARTDWAGMPLRVQVDESDGDDFRQRQTHCAHLALKSSLNRGADYVILLEDDLDFNLHIRHNLQNWRPFRIGSLTLASLYNPGIREMACDLRNNARIVHPSSVFGSQAFLMSREMVIHLLCNWGRVKGMQDIRISRLAGRLKEPILYHAPSLVQHMGKCSTWGGTFHQASDFDRNWRA